MRGAAYTLVRSITSPNSSMNAEDGTVDPGRYMVTYCTCARMHMYNTYCKILRWNFSFSSFLNDRSGEHNLCTIFSKFAVISCIRATIVVAKLAKIFKYSIHWKALFFPPKKGANLVQISLQIPKLFFVKVTQLRHRGGQLLTEWQPKNSEKHHPLSSYTDVRRSISTKLCTIIEESVPSFYARNILDPISSLAVIEVIENFERITPLRGNYIGKIPNFQGFWGRIKSTPLNRSRWNLPNFTLLGEACRPCSAKTERSAPE